MRALEIIVMFLNKPNVHHDVHLGENGWALFNEYVESLSDEGNFIQQLEVHRIGSRVYVRQCLILAEAMCPGVRFSLNL